jgi:glyoxylase-like metal-dependent hydrolase (beta-lactamase superfamily II)
MAVTHRLGNLDLAVLSDGEFYLDAGATFGLVPRVMWEPYAGPLDELHRLTIGLNSLLLRSEGKLILIETGVGDKPRGWRDQASPAEKGTLLSDLASIDVAPADIDIVVNTHLHADHCGWNTRYLGDELVPTFPNAEYIVMQDEWDAAVAPNERTRATYLKDNLQPVAEKGRLRLLDGETKVTDEVVVIPTPGHSAGHASIGIASGGEKALYIGDIAQVAVQLERTAWVSAFDVFPLTSLETKKRVVEQAIEDNSLLISVHARFPGLGRMQRTPEGYRRWVEEPPSPPSH